MLLGISGYLVFTDKTQGNILNNFSPVGSILCRIWKRCSAQYLFKDDTLINVARFCFGLNMFTTLPLELFVCREVRYLSRRVAVSDDRVIINQVIEQYFFEHEEFDRHRHIILTSVILFSSMICASQA